MSSLGATAIAFFLLHFAQHLYLGDPTNALWVCHVDSLLLVIGAGPAGLAIAACLQNEGIGIDHVDRRGVTGGAYRELASSM